MGGGPLTLHGWTLAHGCKLSRDSLWASGYSLMGKGTHDAKGYAKRSVTGAHAQGLSPSA